MYDKNSIYRVFGALFTMLVASCGTPVDPSSSSEVASSSEPASSSSLTSSSSSSSSMTETTLPNSHPELYETELFVKEHVLDVRVEMEDADWDSMRRERPLVSGCHAADYNDYFASVTIDGESHDSVTIRKKGGLGSQSTSRPSIKLNFGKGDEFEGRTFQGDKRLTLNNNRQDASDIKQCLAYYLYNLAGIHSPRCNFANVTLLGNNQGVYTHVEAIKKPFLEWRFGDKSGNLYEMQRDGEFIPLRTLRFQKKTNESEADFSDVLSVTEALALEDEEMYQVIGEHINIKAFARFAIMEAMVGQIDGYTSNQNNTYFYHNPVDDLFYFIPWGADITFTRRHLRESGARVPASLFLGSVLIQRLWAVSEFRAMYDQQIEEILQSVWQEDKIIEEVERMALIVDSDRREVDAIVNYIEEKRGLVEAELEGSASREWRWPLMAPDFCIDP